jgi:hypothetical protein
VVNRQAFSEKGIWYDSKRILRAARRDFQNRGMTPRSVVAEVCCHKEVPGAVES